MANQIGYSWEDDIMPDGKLPGDVMLSILTNLPVKSLLKFKAVCKSWHSLISSPRFIKMHLHRQSVIANMLLLSWYDIDNDLAELNLLSHYEKKNCDDCHISTSELLPSLSSIEDVYVLDSCKGLVCLLTTLGQDGAFDGRHILWNPATRRYRYIELPGVAAFRNIGLGYVEATNDYKILGLSYTESTYMFVYTLSSDSWKQLDYDAKSFPGWTEPPTFINGCINWLSNRCTCVYDCTCDSPGEKIFAFDVENEVMCCFGVPGNYKPGSKISGHTLVIKGCLSIVIFPESEEIEVIETESGEMEEVMEPESEEMEEMMEPESEEIEEVMEPESKVTEVGIHIWVMVEYGVEGSWVKQYTIQGLTAIELPLRSWRDCEILFTYREGEEGLLELVLYALSGEKIVFLDVDRFCTDTCQVFNYVESLASVTGGRNRSIQPGLI